MSTPDPNAQQHPSAAPGWGEDDDRTTYYRPPAPAGEAAPSSGGYNPDPSTMTAEPYQPAGNAENYHSGYGYPAQGHSGPESGATAVFPPAAPPPYAPVSQPQPYAPPAVIAAPAGAMVPAAQRSSAGATVASILLGLVLSVGGLYLAVKFGFDAYQSYQSDFSADMTKLLLAALGGVLLLGAAVLNGWSPWATFLPGLLITALGAYGMFATGAGANLDKWLKFAFGPGSLSTLAMLGILLLIGLVLLGASLGAMMAKASGRRLGRI